MNESFSSVKLTLGSRGGREEQGRQQTDKYMSGGERCFGEKAG